jgi:hypothetical protein
MNILICGLFDFKVECVEWRFVHYMRSLTLPLLPEK